MADDEFEAWFRLLETPGLGPTQARELLAAFGSPEAVLQASPASLRSVSPRAPAAAIAGPAPDTFAERLARAQGWRRGSPPSWNRACITLADAVYPPRLLQTADPPLLLYVEGQVDRLQQPSVAIVGSRNPTPEGESNAQAFAAALSNDGFVVVSGLARGIDAAAHEGALLGAAGTIAILGTGADLPYPESNRGLAERILRHGGTTLSEYAPGTPPLKANFPRRNRIIAGMTLGTLVVEAALRSGSLITARLASEAGREVFAIPGSIHSPLAKGCHALIKQGAKLVEVAADILEELGQESQAPAPAEPAADAEAPADPVLRAMGFEPVTIDALLARTGWPASDLSARLLEFELHGSVARLPGGLFQRRARG